MYASAEATAAIQQIDRQRIAQIHDDLPWLRGLANGSVLASDQWAVDAVVRDIHSLWFHHGGPEGILHGAHWDFFQQVADAKDHWRTTDRGAGWMEAGAAYGSWCQADSANCGWGKGISGHAVLDVAGLIPVLGEVADAINCGWYAVEGNAVDAGLSCAAIIPVLGSGAIAAKYGDDVAAALTAPQATRLTNGAQFETLSSQRISGVTRSGHRATANRQLLSELEADPVLRQFYDDFLGTDVMAHMRSGRSGLRNPPGTEWHHPTWDPESVLLLRRGVHRHPGLQDALHPGPGGSGGFAEHFGGR